jgi:hypothetical protein
MSTAAMKEFYSMITFGRINETTGFSLDLMMNEWIGDQDQPASSSAGEIQVPEGAGEEEENVSDCVSDYPEMPDYGVTDDERFED